MVYIYVKHVLDSTSVTKRSDLCKTGVLPVTCPSHDVYKVLPTINAFMYSGPKFLSNINSSFF